MGRGCRAGLKSLFATCIVTAAAKAARENEAIIAALKRSATQNQVQDRVFNSLLVRT